MDGSPPQTYFAPIASPGYRVEYVDDPVQLSPSDLTIGIAGDATLVLSCAAWMTTMEGNGYRGPSDIAPTNVGHVRALRLIDGWTSRGRRSLEASGHRAAGFQPVRQERRSLR